VEGEADPGVALDRLEEGEVAVREALREDVVKVSLGLMVVDGHQEGDGAH
jgi:hypothetical protein